MKNPAIFTATGLGVAPLPALSSDDTLILRDGTHVSGRVVGVAGRTITFEDDAGVSRRYSADTVDALEFAAASPDTAAGRTGTGGPRLDVLPVGTELTVRTAEDIDASTALVDQTFFAIVERDIRGESNHVVVPAGSQAVLVVREVSSSGAGGGRDMKLDLQSMTVGGQRYFLSPMDARHAAGTGDRTNERTAPAIDGRVVLGTIVGSIEGGRHGAAIGALMRAAGAAGAQVFNRKKDVRVGAATLLTFRLSSPVSLQAEG